MNPAERAAVCSDCQLKRCNEQSRGCLINIQGLGKKVGRATGGTAMMRENAAERRRLRVVNRALLELTIFKKVSPATFEELLAPYRGG